jgi:hypothetical protein
MLPKLFGGIKFGYLFINGGIELKEVAGAVLTLATPPPWDAQLSLKYLF